MVIFLALQVSFEIAIEDWFLGYASSSVTKVIMSSVSGHPISFSWRANFKAFKWWVKVPLFLRKLILSIASLSKNVQSKYNNTIYITKSYHSDVCSCFADGWALRNWKQTIQAYMFLNNKINLLSVLSEPVWGNTLGLYVIGIPTPMSVVLSTTWAHTVTSPTFSNTVILFFPVTV